MKRLNIGSADFQFITVCKCRGGFTRPAQLTGNRQQHSCPQGQNLYFHICSALAGREIRTSFSAG
ncbi:MAG: hypothetical protein LBV41_08890, partial [Cytophagaceae bacterium]|nr:hypothetical protein [Cytophagaceae bacterium]